MTTYLFIFSCSHNMPSTTFGFVVQTHTRKHLLLFCIFYLSFSFKFIGLSDSNVGRINPGKPFKYTSCVWRLVWSDQNQINLTSTLHLLLKREPKGRGFTRRHCPSNVFPISVVFAAFNIVEHTQADLSVGCVLFIQKNSFILPSLTNVFFLFFKEAQCLHAIKHENFKNVSPNSSQQTKGGQKFSC